MISEKLMNDIKEFCSSNDIEDIEKLVNKIVTRGFSIEKYGETPNKPSKPPKTIIEYVDKIVEVEVEKIVEVEVEKIVKISDDSKLNELLEEMNKKETEYNETIKLFKDSREEQTKYISQLNEEILDLKEKLKNKPRDLYGED